MFCFVTLCRTAARHDTCAVFGVLQGNIVRQPGMKRIDFLASVRNAVLAPLQDSAAYVQALQRVARTASAQALLREATAKQLTYAPDKIIFLNDPFFSWQVSFHACNRYRQLASARVSASCLCHLNGTVILLGDKTGNKSKSHTPMELRCPEND